MAIFPIILLIVFSVVLTIIETISTKKKCLFSFVCDFFCILLLSLFFSYSFEFSKSIMPVYEVLVFLALVIFKIHPSKKEIGSYGFPWWGGCVFFAILCKMSLVWVVDTFPLNDVTTVLLTLQMPLNGFVMPFVLNFLLFVFPVSLGCFIVIFFYIKKYSIKFRYIIIVSAILLIWGIFAFVVDVPIGLYYHSIKNFTSDITPEESSFWDSNFVDVNMYSIGKPSQKQNLIFIIMESMENSFADTGNGGVNTANYIPEITKLARENINFSPSSTLGGGIDVNGSLNTISSTIAKLTGLPVLHQAFRDNLSLPGFTSIYEILKKDGYTNFFIQGTNASFAGLESFLKKHGVDSLLDSKTQKHEMDMDVKWQNFRKFFIGLTDRKLYDISRHLLTDSTLLRRPFTLTIATIETHFPYGFYNSNCEIKPDDSKEESLFKATVQCASFDLGNFISWCQKQPFYENTTIIITGDHLFPGSHLVSYVRPNRSWINVFLNSRVKAIKEKERLFTSFDIAPSLLEALGYKLYRHQMGFGISLFSEKKTLLEKYSFPVFTNELHNLHKARQYLERVMGP